MEGREARGRVKKKILVVSDPSSSMGYRTFEVPIAHPVKNAFNIQCEEPRTHLGRDTYLGILYRYNLNNVND